jgi:hypothetical protein
MGSYNLSQIFRLNANLIRRRTTNALSVKISSGIPSVPPPTFVIDQNFETPGTGFDNGETWVTYAGDTGITNPVYAVSPLRGSQSLRMTDDNSEGGYAITKFSDDTGVNYTYGYFMIRFVDFPSGTSEIFQSYNAQGAVAAPDYIEPHEMIWVSASGILHAVLPDPFTDLDGSTSLSTGTVYHVWFYFSRDASKNSTGWIKLNTTSTIPETNEVEWTNASMSGTTYRGTNAAGFTTLHSAGYEYVADRAIFHNDVIGTPPG